MRHTKTVTWHQAYFLKQLSLLAVVLVILILSLPPTRLLAQTDRVFFPQTGKSLSGKFLQYWQTNGGLSVFGYPITEPAEETDPETGKVFVTQWFERNRFELHPEYAGTKYEILLGLLGKDLRREALGIDYTFVPTEASNRNNDRFFKETRHNMAGVFVNYWQSNGALERFGFPISEARDEVDPETGKVFLTQWFERARFELHPEYKGTNSEILLGLLGKQIRTNPPAIEFRWEARWAGFSRAFALDSQANMWLAYDALSSNGDPLFYTRLVKLNNQGYEVSERVLPFFNKDKVIITAMTIDKQGNFYIGKYILYTDEKYGQQEVEKFDPQGRSLLTFGKKGSGPGELQGDVKGLTVDGAGNLYVSSETNVEIGGHKGAVVTKYDQAGKFLGQLGTKDDDHSALVSPSELAIDGDGNLLIVDNTKSEVQKRDTNGNYLDLVGNNCLAKVPYNNDVVLHLAVSPQGQVYISQHKVNFEDFGLCIERVDSDNKTEVIFKEGGLAMGQLHQPEGILVDNQANLFAANYKGQGANVWLDKFHFR